MTKALYLGVLHKTDIHLPELSVEFPRQKKHHIQGNRLCFWENTLSGRKG